MQTHMSLCNLIMIIFRKGTFRDLIPYFVVLLIIAKSYNCIIHHQSLIIVKSAIEIAYELFLLLLM